jgi:hypothetical protein
MFELSPLVFPDRPDFLPQIHPIEMLRYGIQCGNPFRRDRCAYADLPNRYVLAVTVSPNENYFPSVTRVVGDETEYDPLGWFQWFCRFVCGRRIQNIDDLNVAKWKKVGMMTLGRTDPIGRQLLLEFSHDPFFLERRRHDRSQTLKRHFDALHAFSR